MIRIGIMIAVACILVFCFVYERTFRPDISGAEGLAGTLLDENGPDYFCGSTPVVTRFLRIYLG